jgi:hypothetical protein
VTGQQADAIMLLIGELIMGETRKRDRSVRFRVSQEEYDLIKARMDAIGTKNLEAFLRKMALDGMIVRLDMPELKRMISLLGYMGNNVNQIAKRLNESGKYYDTDIEDVVRNQKRLIALANAIFVKLASLK